jgi:hypothetical protein
MAQTEVCVVECDGPGCEESFTAESWTEAHELGADMGWSMTALEDLCRKCG